MNIYKYFNQNHYAAAPYPSPSLPKATVKSGGCGVVCAAMIVSNLTGKTVDPKEMAPYAIKKGARASGGTDMQVLGKALAGDYDLSLSTGTDENSLLAHLKAGGMAIANVGGNRPGYTGVFSDGGHYVVVAGSTSSGKVVVLDPGYYAGKFNKAGRKGKVTIIGNNCVCDVSVLAKDTQNRTPAYWLFARKGGTSVAETVPAWKTQVVKDAEELGLIAKGEHKATEAADKAFVLAVAVNLKKVLEGIE